MVTKCVAYKSWNRLNDGGQQIQNRRNIGSNLCLDSPPLYFASRLSVQKWMKLNWFIFVCVYNVYYTCTIWMRSGLIALKISSFYFWFFLYQYTTWKYPSIHPSNPTYSTTVQHSPQTALFDDEVLLNCLLSDISMKYNLLLARDNISDPIEPLVSWAARWDRYLSDTTDQFALAEHLCQLKVFYTKFLSISI